MNHSVMSDLHQSGAPWAWPLAPHQAITLATADAPRWLHVVEGDVWATGPTERGGQAEDHWLAAGESIALPPGTDWVLEPRRTARVGVVLGAPAAVSHGGRGWRAWWRQARDAWAPE